MTYYTSKQIFYINSRDRLEGTDCDFSYNINLNQAVEYTHVSLLSCSIPKSFYLIQSGYNTFQLQELATTVTVTLTPGNYTRTSLSIATKNALNAASPNGWVYSITFNNIISTYDDGKYNFSVTGNSGQPSLIFGTSIYEQLGFSINSTNTFSGGHLKSTNVCNLSPETTLYLHTDMMQSEGDDTVLKGIYSTGDSSFAFINYFNSVPMEYSKPLRQTKANIYRFYLTNEDGILIDTNGININFTIMVFRFNNIFDLIKGAIKYFTLKDM